MAWEWELKKGLEGHKAINDVKCRGLRKGTGAGLREEMEANTLPWLRKISSLSLVPGKDMKMGKKEEKSNLSNWAKGRRAILVNKQLLCNWPWRDKNREDSPLSPMASAPKQALYYMGFPSPPFPISIILLPNPTQSGLAPRESLARAGTAQPDSIVLHTLCSFTSQLTNLGTLYLWAPLSWGSGRLNRNGTSSWGRERLDRHATRQDDC